MIKTLEEDNVSPRNGFKYLTPSDPSCTSIGNGCFLAEPSCKGCIPNCVCEQLRIRSLAAAEEIGHEWTSEQSAVI
uniref:Uncharacterized protein n=1 Tax=Magallana gigas TaxID=29159 RepID=K1PE86_MAGGI